MQKNRKVTKTRGRKNTRERIDKTRNKKRENEIEKEQKERAYIK